MARTTIGSEPLDEMVSFRVTRSERLILKKLAGNEGHGPFLRRLIMIAWRERRAKRKESE